MAFVKGWNEAAASNAQAARTQAPMFRTQLDMGIFDRKRASEELGLDNSINPHNCHPFGKLLQHPVDGGGDPQGSPGFAASTENFQPSIATPYIL